MLLLWNGLSSAMVTFLPWFYCHFKFQVSSIVLFRRGSTNDFYLFIFFSQRKSLSLLKIKFSKKGSHASIFSAISTFKDSLVVWFQVSRIVFSLKGFPITFFIYYIYDYQGFFVLTLVVYPPYRRVCQGFFVLTLVAYPPFGKICELSFVTHPRFEKVSSVTLTFFFF